MISEATIKKSLSQVRSRRLNKILIIDPIPLRAYAFQAVIRSMNRSASVTHVESPFTVLADRPGDTPNYQLIIIGTDSDHNPESLLLPAGELKNKFPGVQIMIYSGAYDPSVIELVDNRVIDAYVHNHESVEEVKKTFEFLNQGKTYISEILHTLYCEYGLKSLKFPLA